MKGDYIMKVKVDFDYWNTLQKYFKKDEFQLNGNIVHDARIIKRVQYIWQNASKKYLKNIDTKSFAQIWMDLDGFIKMKSYQESYDTFVDYLFYCTDRMSPNRWLSLQMRINKASDLIYEDYCNKYDASNWSSEVCDGWCEDYNYIYNLGKDCKTEWKEVILPLIKDNQVKEWVD